LRKNRKRNEEDDPRGGSEPHYPWKKRKELVERPGHRKEVKKGFPWGERFGVVRWSIKK